MDFVTKIHFLLTDGCICFDRQEHIMLIVLLSAIIIYLKHMYNATFTASQLFMCYSEFVSVPKVDIHRLSYFTQSNWL